MGHRARRGAQAGESHPTPRRARRDVDALLDVALEAREAELSVEPAVLHLAKQLAEVVVDALEAPERPAQRGVEGVGGGRLGPCRKTREIRLIERAGAAPAQQRKGRVTQAVLAGRTRRNVRALAPPGMGRDASSSPIASAAFATTRGGIAPSASAAMASTHSHTGSASPAT